jgi:uncharacterized membrane protein (UPF0127 family)
LLQLLLGFLAACLSPALLAAPSLHQAESPSTLEVRGFRVQVEVARTQSARARGLMGRSELKPDHGMLFVFDAPERICMWMRNTPLPLSVAFLDEQGEIVNIENMEPLTDTAHCATREARFALEMTQGWFQNRSIRPRDRIRLIKP